jgi:hypothetical protein
MFIKFRHWTTIGQWNSVHSFISYVSRRVSI